MSAKLQEIVEALESKAETQFEAGLRAELEAKSSRWLVDQLIEQVLADRHLHEGRGRQLARQAQHVEPLAERKKRLARIRDLGLTADSLRGLITEQGLLNRSTLEDRGWLLNPPHKGRGLITSEYRSAEGEKLLRDAHDLLYALLFCDQAQGVSLARSRRDFLTITLPSAKAFVLERFMLAVTEMPASGTWLDPEGVSDDVEAPNTILQVEFGDATDELVTEALIVVLKLINNLEINEEILYARIEQLERSTLLQ